MRRHIRIKGENKKPELKFEKEKKTKKKC